MKKIIYLFIALFVLFGGIFCVTNAQDKDGTGWEYSKHNPVQLLDTIQRNANRSRSQEVQDTQLNGVTSKTCTLGVKSNFTITKTLCYIKEHINSYLQYFIYIGLAVATIIVIWNGFLLVTSSDRATQIGKFKTNMQNLLIGIVLITAFYFILDVFVSIVNFIAK